MPALREVQEAFCAAMLDTAAEPALLALLDNVADNAQRRIDVYRRTVLGTLEAALAASYPRIERIVGGAFFGEAARRYVLTHPSCSGDLNEYGGEFAEFLAAYPHARDLPYLPDMARLEWQVQSVYYAADAPPADLSALAATAPERWGEVVFRLAPAWARMDSPHPLADIWRVNAEGYADDMAVDFSRGSQVLVLRRGGLVQVRELTAAAAAFFDAVAAGADMASATAAALAVDEDFDPGPTLQSLTGDGLFIGALLPDPAMESGHGHA